MDAAGNPADSPGLGPYLAAERERQGLSRADAAQRLHMSAWQVEALELGDYSKLPQGTFLRGFVRNYARALGLDPEEVLQRLAGEGPRGTAPRIVVPSQNIRFDPLGERLSSPYVKASGLAVAFLAFGFAALYWWFFIRPSPPAMAAAKKPAEAVPMNLAAAPIPAPEPVAARPVPVEVAKAEPPKVEPPKVEPPKVESPKVEPPKPEARKPEPPKAEVAKPAPAKAEAKPQAEIVKVAASKPPAGDRTLKLRFKGESWVEIKDRSGKVLLSKLNAPGSETEVSGRPPFNVIIGNAPEVKVLYEDRDFPLEPHTRVAVARFTVE